MSVPAPSPLNSNFTLIQNTKISASPNMMWSLKNNITAMSDYLHQSKTVMKYILIFRLPLSEWNHIPFLLIVLMRSDAAEGSSATCNAVGEPAVFTARWSRDALAAGVCYAGLLHDWRIWMEVHIPSYYRSKEANRSADFSSSMVTVLSVINSRDFSRFQLLCLFVCPSASPGVIFRSFLALHFSQ